MAWKSDGGLRFCIDYERSHPNFKRILLSDPLPLIDSREPRKRRNGMNDFLHVQCCSSQGETSFIPGLSQGFHVVSVCLPFCRTSQCDRLSHFFPRKSHLAKAHFYPAVTPDKCSFSCDFRPKIFWGCQNIWNCDILTLMVRYSMKPSEDCHAFLVIGSHVFFTQDWV